MRLFDGLGRTDYQDLLRALGYELDVEGACDLRLVEREDGLMVQVRSLDDLAAGFQAYHLSEEDLRALLESAYARRGSGRQLVRNGDYQGIHYQDLLRAIGRVLDAEGLRDVRLIEQPAALVLQVTRGGAPKARLPDLPPDGGAPPGAAACHQRPAGDKHVRSRAVIRGGHPNPARHSSFAMLKAIARRNRVVWRGALP